MNTQKRILNAIVCLALFLMSGCEQKTENTKLESHTDMNQSTMNTLGLIGGTSWHSTLDYYSDINQSVNDYFGNNTNPPLLVYTLNQAEVHRFQTENKWDSIANMLIHAGQNLNKAGAQSVMFCANTPHKVYQDVQTALEIPVIHIADATAKAIQKQGLKKVAFIGTKYSMTEDFITGRIAANGLEVMVPEDLKVIDELHRIIIDELTYGEIKPESKTYVLQVLNKMIANGAEGAILGCTEFPLMIFKDDLDVPIFDTTKIHSQSAVDYILNR